jgi:hypothetical protein
MAVPRTIALFMLCLFLLLPMHGVAQVLTESVPFMQGELLHLSANTADQLPCSDCPCSGANHSECDSTCSCCSAMAPLPQLFSWNYAPTVEQLTATEPYWTLPQVYLPIFVPPQNLS